MEENWPLHDEVRTLEKTLSVLSNWVAVLLVEWRAVRQEMQHKMLLDELHEYLNQLKTLIAQNTTLCQAVQDLDQRRQHQDLLVGVIRELQKQMAEMREIEVARSRRQASLPWLLAGLLLLAVVLLTGRLLVAWTDLKHAEQVIDRRDKRIDALAGARTGFAPDSGPGVGDAATPDSLVVPAQAGDWGWPPAIRDGLPRDWRDKLDQEVARFPDAAMLRARLLAVSAAEQGDFDKSVLLDALKECSRYLIRRMNRCGASPEQVAEEVKRWAEAFNATAQERYSIQVPRLGSQVDHAYMVPRPGVKQVSALHTWAVRDASGIAVYKAEVS